MTNTKRAQKVAFMYTYLIIPTVGKEAMDSRETLGDVGRVERKKRGWK